MISMGATAEERKAILTTSVKNEDNPYYGIDGGRDVMTGLPLSIGEGWNISKRCGLCHKEHGIR